MKGKISKSKLSNVPLIIKYKKHTKIGIYQSTNQKPHFPQFVFELDPHSPQWIRYFVDPHFIHGASPFDGRDSLFGVLENHLKNGLESPLIFVLFYKGKTK